MSERPGRAALRVGVVDTGVNPWHSHVRGAVTGCRVFQEGGEIREDGDFRDLVGHGTAVAGLIRQGLPEAELFAVRVFGEGGGTYPSLVARAVLRCAAEGCGFVNLSLALPPGAGSDALAEACALAQEAGCVLVASVHPEHATWLPAALPGLFRVAADDRLELGDVRPWVEDPFGLSAPGRPRALDGLPPNANLWGPSFACARALVHLAARRAGNACVDRRLVNIAAAASSSRPIPGASL